MAIDIEAPGADEADLKAAIQALANDITVVTISASGALDNTHYGKLVNVDTSGVVITFPAAPATVEILRIYNGSAGTITVNGVLMGIGRDLTFVSIGSAWKRLEPQGASGSGASSPPYPTGRFLAMLDDGTTGSGSAAVANVVYLFPFTVRQDMTVSEIVLQIATLAAGGKTSFAVYAAHSSTLLPTGAPLHKSGDISTAATGRFGNSGLSLALPAGVYWAAALSDNSTVVLTANLNSKAISRIVGNATNTVPFAGNGCIQKTGVTFGDANWPTFTGNYATDGLDDSVSSSRAPLLAMKI